LDHLSFAAVCGKCGHEPCDPKESHEKEDPSRDWQNRACEWGAKPYFHTSSVADCGDKSTVLWVGIGHARGRKVL